MFPQHLGILNFLHDHGNNVTKVQSHKNNNNYMGPVQFSVIKTEHEKLHKAMWQTFCKLCIQTSIAANKHIQNHACCRRHYGIYKSTRCIKKSTNLYKFVELFTKVHSTSYINGKKRKI